MATKSISQLDTQATANETDLFEVAIVDANSASGYASKKESAAAIADAIVGEYQYPLRLTETTSKKISGAINEIAGEVADLKDLDGSASGDIATFVDGSDNPLKELEISIEAVQSGSGDPSPTNVRPISGYSAVDVIRCGKNLINVGETRTQTVGGLTITVNNDGSVHAQGTASFGVGFSLVGENGGEPLFYLKNGYKYTIQETNIQINGTTAKAGMASPVTFTANEGDYVSYAWLYFSQGTTVNATYYPMLELGATATAYEQYNDSTYNIDWQDEAGTVYGGTLDVKTGVLTVLGLKITLSSNITSRWNSGYWSNMWVTNLGAISESDATASDPKVGRCSHFSDTLYGSTRIGIPKNPSLYTTSDELKSWLDAQIANNTPVEFVYNLATPVTYQLTPTEIRSLLGVNNVWADCGSVTELKYTRDLNLCINDIIARIEALEGASSSRSLSVSPTLTKSLTSELDTTEGKTEEKTEEETIEEAQNER